MQGNLIVYNSWAKTPYFQTFKPKDKPVEKRFNTVVPHAYGEDYRYEYKDGVRTRINTKENVKREIQIGDTIEPTDGSWAIVMKNGELIEEQHVAYKPERENWIVLALGMDLPLARDMSTDGAKLFPDMDHNNVLCVNCKDKNKYLFTHINHIGLI